MIGMGTDFLRGHWYISVGVSLSLVALWFFLSQGETSVKTVWWDFLDEIKKDPPTLCLITCFFTGLAILWLPVLIVALTYRVTTMNWTKRLMGRVSDLARNVSACFVGFG